MVPAAARGAAAHVIVDDLEQPVLGDEDRRHLSSVLRLRPGESVGVTDGRGGWRPCRYAAAGALEPDGQAVHIPKPVPELTVALSAVKGERTEWAVQKLTEVGVDRIVVIRCERSVVRWDDDRAGSHLDRLRRVSREAVRQSRSVWVPEVSGVVDVPAAASPGASLAEPGGAPPSLNRPVVLVGPEGGWSPAELGLDLPRVGLGCGVLRTETAAVAAGVLLTALRAGLVLPA